MPVALVTGAGNGIGLVTADELHRRGFDVVYADLDGAAATAAAAVVDPSGGSTLALASDITKTDSIGAMFDAITERFGALDVLVNNAGVPGRHITAEMTDEEWSFMMSVNLDGAFKVSRAAYPLLVESGKAGRASIVNVASISGIGGMTSRAAYSASKSGIIGLTHALSTEWAPMGIRSNAVAPGYVRTTGFDRRMTNARPGIIEQLVTEVPMGRLCRPEEIATAIAFLASSDSSYITGQTLVVDGGVTTSLRG